ncbi:MAG: hypothetical protein M0T84_16565 [Betaproteobacteria bacterium]|nr:hypothetical protein [Betaproteobacteria bacterium]
MEEAIDFGSLLNGLQHMPEKDKIVLLALIDRQSGAQNGEVAKIERIIGQMMVSAAREKQRVAQVQVLRDEDVTHISLVANDEPVRG